MSLRYVTVAVFLAVCGKVQANTTALASTSYVIELSSGGMRDITCNQASSTFAQCSSIGDEVATASAAVGNLSVSGGSNMSYNPSDFAQADAYFDEYLTFPDPGTIVAYFKVLWQDDFGGSFMDVLGEPVDVRNGYGIVSVPFDYTGGTIDFSAAIGAYAGPAVGMAGFAMQAQLVGFSETATMLPAPEPGSLAPVSAGLLLCLSASLYSRRRRGRCGVTGAKPFPRNR